MMAGSSWKILFLIINGTVNGKGIIWVPMWIFGIFLLLYLGISITSSRYLPCPHFCATINKCLIIWNWYLMRAGNAKLKSKFQTVPCGQTAARTASWQKINFAFVLISAWKHSKLRKDPWEMTGVFVCVCVRETKTQIMKVGFLEA